MWVGYYGEFMVNFPHTLFVYGLPIGKIGQMSRVDHSPTKLNTS